MRSRAQLIQLIHIAKSQLGLDDATYRAALAGLELPSSSKHMTLPQLERVLEHMKRSGFRVRSKAKDRAQADDLQSKMLRGMWIEMHKLGYVDDAREAALAAWVKRETGVDALQWLDAEQGQLTIEKLKQWRWRDERRAKRLAAALHAGGRLASPDIAVLAEHWFGAAVLTKAVVKQLLERLKGLK
ncbi:gp16 family protein [Sapientia aquatica]|uniref:Regulatory protein GemA n=1 Tax=Sapientia aquatica TaxID=1549640 RepID=A0A4V3AUS7_9BURK|nr:regulatory protein GemA [Sapientia aquatica]TDK66010.1 regulatory protein GemA [Sapientia aquatica]